MKLVSTREKYLQSLALLLLLRNSLVAYVDCSTDSLLTRIVLIASRIMAVTSKLYRWVDLLGEQLI